MFPLCIIFYRKRLNCSFLLERKQNAYNNVVSFFNFIPFVMSSIRTSGPVYRSLYSISWYFLIVRVYCLFAPLSFYLLILCRGNKAAQRKRKLEEEILLSSFLCSFLFSNSFVSYWERLYRVKYIWYLMYDIFAVVVVAVVHCSFMFFPLVLSITSTNEFMSV